MNMGTGNPEQNDKLERQKSWPGEIIPYTSEDRDDFFRFGAKMWERDLERTWNPPERQKDLVDIGSSYQQHNGGEFWVAKDQEKGIVGCAGLKPVEDTDTLEFTRYYVLSDMRGQKIGKDLIHTAIHHALNSGKKAIVLDTNSEKAKDAIRIFEAVGFEKIEPYKPLRPSDQLPSDLFMKLNLEDYECKFCKNDKGQEEVGD